MICAELQGHVHLSGVRSTGNLKFDDQLVHAAPLHQTVPINQVTPLRLLPPTKQPHHHDCNKYQATCRLACHAVLAQLLR